jgi:hypothetical protein
MPTVSLEFRKAAYAPETGRVIIALITLSHPSLVDDIRISTDPTQRLDEYTTDTDVIYGTVSEALSIGTPKSYIFFPIRIKLPDDTDEGPGAMTLEIDNVHRVYTETIRTLFTPVACNLSLVLDNTPNVIEAQWPEFLLTNIKYDASVISGTLNLELLNREPFPAGMFAPASFPGIF